MAWTDRLLQLTGMAESPSRDPAVAALLPALSTAVAVLTRCADLAPTPTFEADVRPLAEKAATTLERLRTVLREYGPTPPAAGAPRVDGHNHWARLLQALEQHREVRQRLRELAIAGEDSDPQLSRSLFDIGRDVEDVAERLRDLIAHADPQALN
jgi:hypothetical protein